MRRFLFIHPSFLILAALAIALIAEYGFDIDPCIYCTYQRYIFGAAAAFFLHPRTFILGITSLILGTLLSVYQIGLEHDLWKDFMEKCLAQPMNLESIESMRKALASVSSCSDVKWRILGISATIWTLFLQLFLMLYTLFRRKSHDSRYIAS